MSDKEIRVASIINSEMVVINAGENNGIKEGLRFQIYELGDEIFDPLSNEPLGKLELIKGTGKVVNVQKKMATVKSDMKTQPQKIIRKNPLLGYNTMVVEEYSPSDTISFDNVRIGDLLRRI